MLNDLKLAAWVNMHMLAGGLGYCHYGRRHVGILRLMHHFHWDLLLRGPEDADPWGENHCEICLNCISRHLGTNIKDQGPSQSPVTLLSRQFRT